MFLRIEGISLKSVNVRQLKNNPSESLRMAEEGPVVVLNRDTPEGLLISMRDSSMASVEDVRVVVATALFRDGALPLARAARVSGMPIEAFMEHVSRRGIPVVSGDAATVDEDLKTMSEWLSNARSSRARAR